MIRGLALLIALAAAATALAGTASFLSPLVVGVVLGALVVNVLGTVRGVPESIAPGVTFGARHLLRAGIVLLGLRLSLGDVGELGASGLLVVVLVVVVTFVGTQWLARRIGVPDDLGLLVATGYSICGASAIAAMDGVVRADEEETTYAITLVTLCGTLSIFVLPLVGEWIGLAGAAFGTWAGGAVHDVGQVVATASPSGPAAVEAATVVKLTRVVLLAPLVALVAVQRRRRAAVEAQCPQPAATSARAMALGAAPNTAATPPDAADAQPPLLPLFVIGFLVAVALRSTGWLDASVLDGAARIEKAVLTVALVALGMGVRLDRMRRLGGRPLVLGAGAWVLVAGSAYIGTALVT